MDFELSPPPIVQKKKKYATFTIKEIGGPAEIIKWRAMQEAKESIYRLRLKTRDNRIAAFEQETGQKLDAPTVSKESWSDKVAFAESERKRLQAQQEDVESWVPTPEQKKTLFQKVIGFVKRIWTNANF